MHLKSLSATAFLLSATALSAQPVTLQDLVALLQQQGFDEVEIEREDGNVKVKAKGAETTRLLVYDAAGNVIFDQTLDGDDDDALEDLFDDDDDDEDDDEDEDEDDDEDEDEDDDDEDDDDEDDDDEDDDD